MSDFPFQIYGNRFSQIVIVELLLMTLLTISSIVAIESQPDALLSVSEYVPAAISDFPFQVYGNWFSQIVIVELFLMTLVTIRSIVEIESQPEALLSVSE